MIWTKNITLYFPNQLSGLACGSVVKIPPASAETQVWCLGQEDPLEKEMATHSSILAWEILWTEEFGGLQYTGLQRVKYTLGTEHATSYPVT